MIFVMAPDNEIRGIIRAENKSYDVLAFRGLPQIVTQTARDAHMSVFTLVRTWYG
jgi:hypothetical protein